MRIHPRAEPDPGSHFWRDPRGQLWALVDTERGTWINLATLHHRTLEQQAGPERRTALDQARARRLARREERTRGR